MQCRVFWQAHDARKEKKVISAISLGLELVFQTPARSQTLPNRIS